MMDDRPGALAETSDTTWHAAQPRPGDSRKADRERNRLRRRLMGHTGRAVEDFGMIRPGERILVCLSGGKDSWVMLDLLCRLQSRAPIDFELHAVNLDQKQPGFPAGVIPGYLAGTGVPFTQLEEDTYSLVTERVPEGKTYCGWCSRFRRGILYRFAKEQGFTRIALGHHRDDMVETLFLNLFYGGRLKAMPPKLVSDDGANVVIRPLAYCPEQDIAAYASASDFPIIPCNLCNSQDGLQRQVIKSMLQDWEKRHPGRIQNIFRAMQNTVPEHLLDRGQVDFTALEALQIPLQELS